MLLQRMGSRPGSLSDTVNLEVIGGLYGSMVPIVLAGVSQAIAGAITVWQTADVATLLLTVIGVAIAVLRAWQIRSGRRRLAAQPPRDRAAADRRKLHYAIGTAATSLVLGLFAARALMLDDAICAMMAMGIAFGFGAGIVARLSMVPLVALADLAVLGLPPIAVALARLDLPHVGLAMLIALYLFGSFEMVRLMFNSTITHITLKQQFEQLARIDPMTGLFNRSALATDLARMIADRGDRTVAIHAIDLDHFKAANDRFGHPVGDALLREVAARLTSLAAPGDLVVRMGGDEFILAQTSVRCHGEAERMARRIFETVSAPYAIAGHDIVIGASIGVALSGDDGPDAEAMLSRSDQALYQAKSWRGGYALARDLPAGEGAAPVHGNAQAPRRRQRFDAAVESGLSVA
ncbi:MAG: diguanylate cyclase [Xanthobacteraceae bacterium]|nr:diguanylate cyclase [Xanthobacteraceae bacterium]